MKHQKRDEDVNVGKREGKVQAENCKRGAGVRLGDAAVLGAAVGVSGHNLSCSNDSRAPLEFTSSL